MLSLLLIAIGIFLVLWHIADKLREIRQLLREIKQLLQGIADEGAKGEG